MPIDEKRIIQTEGSSLAQVALKWFCDVWSLVSGRRRGRCVVFVQLTTSIWSIIITTTSQTLWRRLGLDAHYDRRPDKRTSAPPRTGAPRKVFYLAAVLSCCFCSHPNIRTHWTAPPRQNFERLSAVAAVATWDYTLNLKNNSHIWPICSLMRSKMSTPVSISNTSNQRRLCEMKWNEKCNDLKCVQKPT